MTDDAKAREEARNAKHAAFSRLVNAKADALATALNAAMERGKAPGAPREEVLLEVVSFLLGHMATLEVWMELSMQGDPSEVLGRIALSDTFGGLVKKEGR